MKILAIDAGTIRSGFCFFDTETRSFYRDRCLSAEDQTHGKLDNGAVATYVMNGYYDHLVMEDITPFSQVGATTIETIKWLGRFEVLAGPASKGWRGFPYHTYIGRQQVKKHLLGKVNGMKDKHVREAVIKRLYPQYSRKDPGPLKGVTADVWSALALAITFADKQEEYGYGKSGTTN